MVSGKGADAQEWKVFEDRTLGFRVELPGTPSVSEEPTSVGKGVSVSHGDLSIDIAQIPLRDGLAFKPFIDEYQKEAVDLFKLPLLELRHFLWNSHPAADLALGAPGHYVLIRIISLHSFSIVLIASDSGPIIGSPIVTRVLDSLSLH